MQANINKKADQVLHSNGGGFRKRWEGGINKRQEENCSLSLEYDCFIHVYIFQNL